MAPEKFTDLQSSWLSNDSLLKELSAHLSTLGQKVLPDTQSLQIEVTDIDLAGSMEYHWRLSPMRVMRDISSPHITLRWRMASADPSAAMTEVSLRDTAYLTRINHYSDGDPLRYEKQMLDDWFQRSFAPHK
jgi:hypothetical protein